MLSILLSLLSPISNIFKGFFSTEQTKIQADAAVETASIQSMGAVEEKWWFVAVMIPVFGLPFGLYTWKAIVWDKLIAPYYHIHASTDPITGTLGYIFMIVVGGLFLQAMKK